MNTSEKLRFLKRWALRQTIYNPPSDSHPCLEQKGWNQIPNPGATANPYTPSPKPTTSCASSSKTPTSEYEHLSKLAYLLNQLLVRRGLKDLAGWLDAEGYQSISITRAPILVSGQAETGLIIKIFRAGELCAERCVLQKDI